MTLQDALHAHAATRQAQMLSRYLRWQVRGAANVNLHTPTHTGESA